MKKIITSTAKLPTVRAIALGMALLCAAAPATRAQQLEFGASSYSQSAMGPSPTSANANSYSTGPATLYKNIGVSGTFTPFSPPTTVSVSFSNQQYTSATYPGLVVGAVVISSNTNTVGASRIFAPMDNIANPLSNMFTSAPDITTAGTNIDAFGPSSSANNATNQAFRINTDAYYQLGQPLTARNYYGDITVTFNRPVINPVLHFSGFGGSFTESDDTQGFYTELEMGAADVAAGRTLTRLSGSTHFILDATQTKLLNDATAKTTTSTTGLYNSNQQNAGGGSVRVNSGGAPLTSITFRVYLKGDGGTSSEAMWGESGSGEGRVPDTWMLGASLGLYNVSGHVYNDITADNTVNGTGTNAGGLFANLVDLNGNIFASVGVNADGSYTFVDVPTSIYNIVLTTVPAAVGSPLSTASLPPGYSSTGENVGAGPGTDGTANSILTVQVLGANAVDANFGIVSCVPSTPATGAVTQPTCMTSTGSVELTGLPVAGSWTINISPATPGATGTSGSGASTVIGGLSAGSYSFTVTNDQSCTSPSSAQVSITAPICLSIGGNVFDDANGLTNNIVDGTATNAGGLTAVLVDAATGNVIAAVPVAANGIYQFASVAPATYNVMMTTHAAAVGQPGPEVALPIGWAATGEMNCQMTAGCSGGDGSVDGMLSLGNVSASITQANFGIEQLPESDNKSGTLASQPPVGQQVPLDGTFSGAAELTGSDPEDGPATTGLTGKTIAITSLPTQGELWYNGVQITGASLASPMVISNYDPSRLVIHLTGSDYSSTTFNYAYVDAAGLMDPSPATYTLSWEKPLPIRLVRFEVVMEYGAAVLTWSTAEETASSHFEIQRSRDGKNWTNTGRVSAAGESRQVQDYRFEDPSPAYGSNLYRLKMVDYDGTYALSGIQEAAFVRSPETSVWPNPASDYLNLPEPVSKLEAFDQNGRCVLRANGSVRKINVSQLQPGMYTIRVASPEGKISSYKVMVHQR